MRTKISRLTTLGLILVAVAGPVAAQRTTLGMLDGLERGSWELRSRDPEVPVRRICVRTGRELIRLRHVGTKCRSVTVNDTAGEVTIQYTCPGMGYGRTSVRRETNALVQIDSQGIANGRPYAFAAEARRVGGC